MKILEEINKTREYLDYIEEHVLNVKKAWEELKLKCKDMRFIYDDFYYFSIDTEIEHHDLSKMSEQEFIQYRKAFYPTDDEKWNCKYNISSAWEHHKDNNPHHWENWTSMENRSHPNEWEVHCVCMICDWMAMSYKFGGTAKSYYEKNKDKINISGDFITFIYQIFDRIYGADKCE
jgi:hypothetical protein